MMTKREVIKAMLNEEVIKSNESYMSFLIHEIELMDRKNEARKSSPKAIAKAEEGARIKNAILELLTEDDASLSASVIRDRINIDCSVPKVASVLTKLKNDGIVIREVKGKSSTYHLA